MGKQEILSLTFGCVLSIFDIRWFSWCTCHIFASIRERKLCICWCSFVWFSFYGCTTKQLCSVPCENRWSCFPISRDVFLSLILRSSDSCKVKIDWSGKPDITVFTFKYLFISQVMQLMSSLSQPVLKRIHQGHTLVQEKYYYLSLFSVCINPFTPKVKKSILYTVLHTLLII